MTDAPSVRNPARQRRSSATFEVILTAAGELYDQVGVESTTMDAVARRAGVSIGSVYRFFENKAAIDATIAFRWHERITEVALPQFTDASLARDSSEVIAEFVAGFQGVLDGLPGARGLLASSRWGRESEADDIWLANMERFIERYAPGLPAARRRRAADTFRSVTIALMVGTATAGSGTASPLHEIHSVLVGYTRQLSVEAAAAHR